jgi:aminoglycoside phosphotransferase family enzyme
LHESHISMNPQTSLIHDLSKPSALPDQTNRVTAVQTHISIVFLADDYVYKVKKPVNFGFLDFSTLEKRHHYCQKEVELNRRFSKGLYLGVLPVTYDGSHYSLREMGGEAVDYAVKMRRIPDERLMKSLFERGGLSREHLNRVAKVLAAFHVRAPGSPEIARFGEPDRFRVNTDENFEQVESFVGRTVSRGAFEHLRRWTDGFYASNKDLFRERIRAGKVRDCHGDLHMEHVAIGDEIDLFDCIEFNDRFRYSDTLADVAFLLMDLEFHGGGELSVWFLEDYKRHAHESNVEALLTFYKTYRAFVRGKVTGFELEDPRIDPKRKNEAMERARRYFELARSYTE